ncbi:MAG: hypothetical protein WBI45_06330 [Defluviitoga tunisiensis]
MKKTELETIGNFPEKIKVGDKEYEIKSPSLGVSSLIAREMQKLLEIVGFDVSKYDDTTKLETMVTDILRGIYDVITSEKSEQAIDCATRIISLLINNSKEEKIITSEEIKWNMSIKDFTPLLIQVIRMADISDFFLMALKMAQAYDVEGILSDSQK